MAFKEAKKLLLDGNNDRAEWIAAGRALIHAKRMKKLVKEDSHKWVLELRELGYRRFFNDILADKTASFFYGAKDPSVTTEQAAKESTKGEKFNGMVLISTLKSIDDCSLYAVWQASQWPEDYKDPLGESFPQSAKNQTFVSYPGLHEYLKHIDEWISASGKLFKKTEGEKPN